jgi:hypothetical protein
VKIEFAVVGIIVLVAGLLVGSCCYNNRLNDSMVGQSRGALVEQFGPPASTAPSGPDSEVLEWIRHEPGYYSQTWHSTGKSGGYYSTTYIPPRDIIRRAVVRGGRVESCKGGW